MNASLLKPIIMNDVISAVLRCRNKWEPLKTGVKSKNGQGVPASRKADEVRLYALRGGLTTKMVRTAHFRSHKVFRGDQIII